MSIQVDQVLKVYGEQVAVDRISFSIDKGEIVGFLGPNGAGKSTTMKMLNGFLQADAGRIEICGIPVTGEALETKRKIGYLPELNPLYPDMYVRGYLQLRAGLNGIKSAGERIEAVISMTGLTSESHKEIAQLSKGYKQRVGLAAALLHDPEVLILDEPTTGLDPNQLAEIRELIRELGKTRTILFSTHIMQEVEAVCDRVIVINRGSIVADRLMQDIRNEPVSASVKVRFRENVEEHKLNTINGVTAVLRAGEGEYTLETGSPDDLAKELMTFALQHNLNIVSLQTQTQSLEDVFRTLTGAGE
jgi:ABC-2 type transport system ATP-binding protein